MYLTTCVDQVFIPPRAVAGVLHSALDDALPFSQATGTAGAPCAKAPGAEAAHTGAQRRPRRAAIRIVAT